MPAPAARELYRGAVDAGLCPMAYTPAAGLCYAGEPGQAARGYLAALSPLHTAVRDEAGTSLVEAGALSMILLDEPERLRAFLGERCAALGLAWSVGKSAYTAGLGVGEVQASDANKASAALALARELGLGSESLCAFGDNMNDLPLLLAAGEAYCPPDAVPAVLAAIPGRIAAAEEEGVARFLEALD
jgi:hydroxymethylpyrimidine pyrophosphatase-like HAD family hydrolase